MRVMMSGSNGRSRSSICSNHGRSNTSRRSSGNQKIDQQGQASTPVGAVGATALVNCTGRSNSGRSSSRNWKIN